MNEDRDQVLNNIRESLKTAHLPAARATIPPRIAPGQGDPRAMTESFCRELEMLGGRAYVARDAETAIGYVLKIAGEAGGSELLTWNDAELPLRGVGDALRARNYTRLAVDLPSTESARHERLDALGRATVGITGAFAGLADTGSLALLSGQGRPRLASLLPETHIALLPTSHLFPTMAAFVSAFPSLTTNASNLVFISGPSRTADIELTLTRGVHGPKYIHAILLDWSE